MADFFEEIIRFAMAKEEEAAAFYEMAAKMTKDPMRTVFGELAATERGHRAMLANWRQETAAKRQEEAVEDLKISDYLVEAPVSGKMSYQDVLIVAMKREERALALYRTLAQRSRDEGSRRLFERLAEEESKHKLRIESEYDRVILAEA